MTFQGLFATLLEFYPKAGLYFKGLYGTCIDVACLALGTECIAHVTLVDAFTVQFTYCGS